MTDVWVCSTCHSINRQRNSSCYKCGAPQSEATGEGSTHRVEQALASRAFVPYRSAWLRGLIASFFILIVAGLGVVLLILSFDDVAWARDQLEVVVNGGTFDEAELLERSLESIPFVLARYVALVLAVLYFSAWLSRVIMNIPALGGGVPRTTPTKAFIYPLIPILNLVKVPGMIQDALYRLDPKAGGFFMVAIAWFGLVGSWIFGFIAGWVIDIKLFGDAARAETPAELTRALQTGFDLMFALELAQWIMVAIGSLILVGVMMRIERRSSARDREIREAALAPKAEEGSVEARPGGVSWEAAAGTTPHPPAEPASSSVSQGPAPDVLGDPDPGRPIEGDTPSFPVAPPPLGAAATVPGPLGAMPSTTASDEFLNRPITAVTGAASIPAPAATEEPPVIEEAPVAEEPPMPAAGSEQPETPLANVPTGPRLHLRVESATSMIATLDGESEAITLEELRAAAIALARADGSATIATTATTFEARTLAQEAFEALSDARVPATMED